MDKFWDKVAGFFGTFKGKAAVVLGVIFASEMVAAYWPDARFTGPLTTLLRGLGALIGAV